MLWGSVGGRSHDKQRDAAADKDSNVEDDICLGHLLHPPGRHGVDESSNDCKASHDCDILANSWDVGEVGSNADCSQEQGGSTPLTGSNTCDLTEEVQPSSHPADGSNPVLGREARDGICEIGISARGQCQVECFGYLQYRPPQVGYAETSSETAQAMHMQPEPAISHDHTADALPPARIG